MKLRVLDTFSGIGGFSLGLERTGGFETVAFCEIEEYPRKVLKKHWPDVPIYEDIRNVTKERLDADGIGRIDVITGGFPPGQITISTGNAKELTGNTLDYGSNAREFLAKYDPGTRSLRTSQHCFLETTGNGLQKYSGTWPRSGILVNGIVFRLATLAQITNATGSGYLPTPTSHNAKEGAYPAEYTRNTPTLSAQIGGKINPIWNEWRMGFKINHTALKP